MFKKIFKKDNKKELKQIIVEEVLNGESELDSDSPLIKSSKTKEDVLNEMNKIMDLKVKPAENFIKRKNKYDIELEELRLEVESLLETINNSSHIKKSKNMQTLLLATMVLTICGASYFGYDEIGKFNNKLDIFNKELKVVKVSLSENNSEKVIIDNIDIKDTIIKDINEKIGKIEKISDNLSDKVKVVETKVEKIEIDIQDIDEKFKAISQVLDLVNANINSINNLNKKIGETKNIENKSDIEKTEYDKMLLEFKNVNSLMSEVVGKQKEEILNLNTKVSNLEKNSETSSKGEVTNLMSKEDKNKVMMLETRLLKNNDIINNLSSSFNKFLEEYNIDKIKLLENKRAINNSIDEAVNIDSLNKNNDALVEKPPFIVNKIIDNKIFYIKNRSNGKLFEKEISIGDIIIDRYEVINIDKENNMVVFKDYELKKSLVLLEND